MNFEDSEMGFREASSRHAEPKRRFDAGRTSVEEFDAQRLRLVVRDDECSWWVKGRTTGGLCSRIESGWVRRTSQGYRSPLAEGTAEHCSQQDQTGSFLSGSQVRESARPSRDPSRTNRLPRKRFQLARQPAIGAVMAQTLRLRYSKARCMERSARRKGWVNDEQVLC
jgi:hypothetical protein